MEGHIACIKARRNAHKILVGNLNDIENFKDLCIGWRKILKLGWEDIERFNLAQDGHQGRVLVNQIMEFLTSWANMSF